MTVYITDYEHDKYSAGDPCKTICCRGDLEPRPELSGCYDTKVGDDTHLLIVKSIIDYQIISQTRHQVDWL